MGNNMEIDAKLVSEKATITVSAADYYKLLSLATAGQNAKERLVSRITVEARDGWNNKKVIQVSVPRVGYFEQEVVRTVALAIAADTELMSIVVDEDEHFFDLTDCTLSSYGFNGERPDMLFVKEFKAAWEEQVRLKELAEEAEALAQTPIEEIINGKED